MNIDTEAKVLKYMDRIKISSLLALFLWISASAGAADYTSGVSNSTVRSPVGSGTVPQSSIQSGLTPSSYNFDTSRHFFNTSGGISSHFNGVVPYTSSNESQLRLQSAITDPSLRYLDSSGISRYNTANSPVYTSSRSVLGSPGSTPMPSSGTGPVVKSDYYAGQYYQLGQYRYSTPVQPETLQAIRPLGMTDREFERLLFSNITTRPQSQPISQADIQSQIDKAVTPPSSLKVDLKQVQLPIDMSAKALEEKRLKIPKNMNQEETVETNKQEKPDVYEQMLKDFQEFQKQYEKLTAKKQSKSTKEANAPENATKQKREETVAAKKTSQPQQRIGEEQKSFAISYLDTFNEHMRNAEKCMKDGLYYKAADYYTLAYIYKQYDPLPYAGKGHALFAAGDFVSAAEYIAEAFERFPGFLKFKIDIVSLVGDKDKIENRLSDIEKILKTANSAELHFLLAYMYYELDRTDRAKEEIQAAYALTPNAPAVKMLKDAIIGQ